MHALWRAYFSRRARFTRIGMTLLLFALVAWVTIDTIHDHRIPNLKHAAEFLALSAAALYSIDLAAGNVKPRR